MSEKYSGLKGNNLNINLCMWFFFCMFESFDIYFGVMDVVSFILKIGRSILKYFVFNK